MKYVMRVHERMLDGTFRDVPMKNPERDAYNRPYRGTMFFDTRICYKTRLVGNILHVYIVDRSHPICKNITLLRIKVKWDHGKDASYVCCQSKYKKGKRCKMRGYTFTMGDVIERVSAFQYVSFSPASSITTCVI